MAMVNTPVFPQTIKNWNLQFLTADASALKTLVTGATNGTKVESILVYSSDTSARDMVISVLIGGTAYSLSTVSIPLNAGNTNAIPCVSFLVSTQLPGLQKDQNGNPYLYLPSTTALQFNIATTVTAGKAINIFAQGSDF